MIRKVVVVTAVVLIAVACTRVKVIKYETPPPEAGEQIPVDVTGMSEEQKELARGMIDEVISLIKAGKTEREIVTLLGGRQENRIARYRVEAADSPSRGPEDAKVTIIEFSDFQCPFSKRIQPVMEKILEKLGVPRSS